MEQNIQPTNNERGHLLKLTNEELDHQLTHAFIRVEEDKAELERLLYERHRRMGGYAMQEELDFSSFNDGFTTDGMGTE